MEKTDPKSQSSGGIRHKIKSAWTGSFGSGSTKKPFHDEYSVKTGGSTHPNGNALNSGGTALKAEGHVTHLKKGYDFVAREQRFAFLPTCLRESSVPPQLDCCLVVDICGGLNGNISSHECGTAFRFAWMSFDDVIDYRDIADDFVQKQCAEGRSPYLVSVSFSIIEQQRLPQAQRLHRNSATKSQDGEQRSLARTSELEYTTQHSEIFSNLPRLQDSWSEITPRATAKLLYENPKAIYLLEIKFKYQTYASHQYESCEGGEECLGLVRKSINDQLITTYDRKKFVLDSFLDQFFSEPVVAHLLESMHRFGGPNESVTLDAVAHKSFTRTIWRSGTRLLAICIYAYLRLSNLVQLIQHGIKDVNLPLRVDSSSFPDDWDHDVTHLFSSTQGMFKAHFFPSSKDEVKNKIDLETVEDGVIMPFLSKESLGQGGYAMVHSVEIHDQYHGFGNRGANCFAIKSFPRTRNKDFEREKNICEELAKNPHDHLTPFLTVWADSANFNILFPKAESDLHNFLMSEDPPLLKTDKLEWLLEQMHGLSEGLAAIHLLAGSSQRQRIVCHHDLKPSNILVFKTYGNQRILKIADFGLARIKDRSSRHPQNYDSPRSDYSKGDWEYMAPEKWPPSSASRPSDLWSLGCIFLVTLLWFFDKPQDDVLTFREARETERTMGGKGPEIYSQAFWKMDNRKARFVLKSAVYERLRWLETEAMKREKQVLKDLVALVRYDMIRPDPNRRKTAPEICSELKNLSQRATRDMKGGENFFDDETQGPGKELAPGLSVVGQSSDVAHDDLDMDEGLYLDRLEKFAQQNGTNAEDPTDLANMGSHLQILTTP